MLRSYRASAFLLDLLLFCQANKFIHSFIHSFMYGLTVCIILLWTEQVRCGTEEHDSSCLIYNNFYSASELLAMQTAVIATSCLSVCQTRALWQNGRKICPDFYTIWKIF